MLTLSVRNRSKSKRTSTPKIDELLESIGLMRHVVPRDGNSLFRCISQCVFLTQSCYMIVRRHLLQFSTLQTKEFNQMTQLSASKYERKITDTKLDGELLDMRIAAKLYNINIAFYVDAHPFMPLIIETPYSTKTLNICLNYEGSYDLVLFKETVVNISLCQAIVYEMLYNNVFKLSGVDFAVKEMLFERNLPSSRSNDPVSLEKRATCTDMKELIEIGITPFPFKVAKALTPKLYRNTEYDIWLNNKKEKFYGIWNNWEFKEGSKCMVAIGNKDYHCYIQCIRGKNEPVEVYVKDWAQKMCVEFDQLKLISLEQDVREMTENPIQVSQMSSTTDCKNGFIYQVADQGGTPQYSNSGLMHRYLPCQIIPPCYVDQYQQQSAFPMNSLNSTNIANVMHPWYISTPPPLLPNDIRLVKENFVLLESTSNFNRNCISPNFPPANCMDNVSKVGNPNVQAMLSPWYYDHQPSTSSRCMQSNNDEESSMVVNSNHTYQLGLVPDLVDVPADEMQTVNKIV